MSLNIKNERTVALVRELAALSGESQTSAVETAVYERLQALKNGHDPEREARNAKAHAILAELRASLTDEDHQAVIKAQAELYDDAGLPR